MELLIFVIANNLLQNGLLQNRNRFDGAWFNLFCGLAVKHFDKIPATSRQVIVRATEQQRDLRCGRYEFLLSGRGKHIKLLKNLPIIVLKVVLDRSATYVAMKIITDLIIENYSVVKYNKHI